MQNNQNKISLLNNNPQSIYSLAVDLYFSDRCEEALDYFYQLEKLNLYSDQVCVYLAHCLSKTRKNLLLALKYINKAIKNYFYDYETKINVLMLKAEIQYRMNDLDLAFRNFQKAYEMGDNDKSLCYISQIFIDKNQPLQAMKYICKLFHIHKIGDDIIGNKIINLTFEELKVILCVLLNRYELNENKKQIDNSLFDSIQKKLY